jgi:hypothetical protein
MTAVSPMVLLLIGVAVLVAVLMGCAAFGHGSIHMDGPDEPWWAGRSRHTAQEPDGDASGPPSRPRDASPHSPQEPRDTSGPTSSHTSEMASDQGTEGDRAAVSEGTGGRVVNKHTSDLE